MIYNIVVYGTALWSSKFEQYKSNQIISNREFQFFQFSVDLDLDSDLDSVVDFVFVVQMDVVVGLELGFLIVVFVKDRLLICSSCLLFLALRKHRRDQTNLCGKDLKGLKRVVELWAALWKSDRAVSWIRSSQWLAVWLVVMLEFRLTVKLFCDNQAIRLATASCRPPLAGL